jgi:predicted transposase YdaD
MAMTWSETLKAKGREEGRSEGHREGMEQGAHQVLLHLLGKRFGPLPEPSGGGSRRSTLWTG